ncbi:hypothetical protein R3W88_025134 [Solanum pinnatisectum]|uniref:F-box associated beta-propeller type 1 domain-containing protein n=1 Tax=Solanum pinnatisectum TaxID=50273 RepID=A0AAV9M2D6_9SOLN|nr:hypothetical protein R3W88_025134 [Solanum pinnatisectum]
MMFERTVYSFRDCSVSSLFNNSFIEANNLDYPRQVPCGVYIVGSVNGLIYLVSREKELFLWNPSIKVQEVKRYSLKSDSWRTVDNCPSIVPLQQPGRFVNGKLHWITIIDPKLCIKRSIISFDLADGKWGEMELPCYWKRGRGAVLSLGVLGSELSVCCDCDKTNILDVWLMKEYEIKESWMKMFTIKIPEDQSVYGYLGQIRLHMASGSEILVVFGSSFMIYNPKGNLLRSSKVINFNNWDEAEIYIESLVCPFSTVRTEDATKKEAQVAKQRSNK